jgi:hypothetical protein
MRFRWNEIIALGSFLAAIFARNKMKKKPLEWFCWAVCFVSLCVLFYNVEHPEKPHTDAGQKAETTGNSSPAASQSANSFGSNSHITQTVINNPTSAIAGTAVVENKGTVVYSINQQGGIMAQSVAITVTNNGETFKASVVWSNDFVTKLQGKNFVTSGTFRLVSPYPVTRLYIIAMEADGITFTPKRNVGMSVEGIGRGSGYVYYSMNNASPGDYTFSITSSTNRVEVDYRIE